MRNPTKKRIFTFSIILIVVAAMSVGVTAIYSSLNGLPRLGSFHIPTSTPPFVGSPFQADVPTEIPASNPSQANNCTYTDFYWQQHPDKWPAEVQIAGKPIDRQEAAALFQVPNPSPFQAIERALYVTQLNIRAGADQGTIQSTIQNANTWLADNPPGTQLSDFNRSTGVNYQQTLQDFDNGLTGPGLCSNQLATPTPGLQAIAGSTPTPPTGATPTGATPTAVMKAYTVQPCDTLGGIAGAFHVKVTSLLAANPHILYPNYIFVGEQIHIPAPNLSANQSIWSGFDFNANSPLKGNVASLFATEALSSGSTPVPMALAQCKAAPVSSP